MLAKSYSDNSIRSGDILFFSDLWFPGIEMVRYLDFFERKAVKIRGLLHAGSFTDTDFVRQLERWASHFETAVFDIVDKVYVGSNFSKREVCSKRLLNPNKVKVTGFPLDPNLKKYAAFMKEFKDRPWIFVEFDVYGHLEKKAIDEQYSFFSSIVGRDKFIRVYHPIIDGGTLKVLDEWIEQGQSYIGVGNDSIPYLDPIFKRTRDRVKVHGFAMTKFDLLTRYPFYSVDSTSTISAFMYGSYSKGSLKTGPKQQLIKNKDPDFFKSPTRHMIEMVDDLKKTEKFLTNLWEKRGVVWND